MATQDTDALGKAKEDLSRLERDGAGIAAAIAAAFDSGDGPEVARLVRYRDALALLIPVAEGSVARLTICALEAEHAQAEQACKLAGEAQYAAKDGPREAHQQLLGELFAAQSLRDGLQLEIGEQRGRMASLRAGIARNLAPVVRSMPHMIEGKAS